MSSNPPKTIETKSSAAIEPNKTWIFSFGELKAIIVKMTQEASSTKCKTNLWAKSFEGHNLIWGLDFKTFLSSSYSCLPGNSGS